MKTLCFLASLTLLFFDSTPSWAQLEWNDVPKAISMDSQGKATSDSLLNEVSESQEATNQLKEEGEGKLLFDLFKTTLALILVCLLLFLFVKFVLKRFVPQASSSGDSIEILERFPLEPKRMVYLLRIKGQNIVVGSSELGLQPLGSWPHEQGISPELSRDSSSKGTNSQSFVQVLKEKMKQKPIIEKRSESIEH